MTPLIFLDLETTGVRPDRHRVWEAGWVTAVHDPTVGTITRLTTVEAQIEVDLGTADPEALRVGRYHQRFKPFDAVSPGVVIKALTSDLADVARVAAPLNQVPIPVHLVGACVNFDQDFLFHQWLGWPDFGRSPWHYHLVDVEALAAGKLGVPPPWSSDYLAGRLGVTINEADRHTALGDAEWAMRMYAAIFDAAIV